METVWSIASDSHFFGFAFSPSSAFRRLASDSLPARRIGLPLVEGRAAEPVLAAQVGRLRPDFLLSQDPDDLFFGDRLGFMSIPLRGDGLYSFLEETVGLRSPARGLSLAQERFPNLLRSGRLMPKTRSRFPKKMRPFKGRKAF